MIKFPLQFEEFLLHYIKEEFFRGTKRASFISRPFGKEDLYFFSKGVSKLSELFTAERAKLTRGYLNQPELRAAYLLYFLPINFAKTCYVLQQIPPLFWQRKTYRVLDLGSGPGSASLAFLHFLKEKNPSAQVELTLVEQNEKALRDAKELSSLYQPLLKKLQTIPSWLSKFSFHGEYDLILMSHVLNEMTEYGAQQRAEWLLPKIQDHLSSNGILAISEPALKRPTRELMALRDHLLEEKELMVLAPCLHEEICPMLAATRNDWCHFYVEWNEPEYLQRLDRLIKNENRFLKVAYLLLGRKDFFGTTLKRPADLFRVVSNRMKTRGKTEAVLCGPPGRIGITLLDREKSAVNEALDQSRRGDLLSVPELASEDYHVDKKFRASRNTKIKLID